jgi:hypothetical protein
LGAWCKRVQTESLMQRIVSTYRAFAASSAIGVFRQLPARVVRRVMNAPAAFIDAIERFAMKY